MSNHSILTSYWNIRTTAWPRFSSIRDVDGYSLFYSTSCYLYAMRTSKNLALLHQTLHHMLKMENYSQFLLYAERALDREWMMPIKYLNTIHRLQPAYVPVKIHTEIAKQRLQHIAKFLFRNMTNWNQNLSKSEKTFPWKKKKKKRNRWRGKRRLSALVELLLLPRGDYT